MRTIIFTLNNNNTRNARAVCQTISGKRYDTPSSFIELLIKNNIIRTDNEVIVYEMGEFTQEINATAASSVIPKDTAIGYISVK
jgi:hypothetical protein